MFNIGPQELILILAVALIVVGPRRLPEIGRSIGRGLRELRKAQDEVRRTVQLNLDEEEPRRPAATAPDGSTAVAPQPPKEAGPSADGLAATAGAAVAPVKDISRTLGRGLAELRKTRREIERSFRVDLGEPAAPRGASQGKDRPEPPTEPSPPAASADRTASE